MSCCGCSEYYARVTNVLKHDEILYKFTELTGIGVITNTFICDPCIELLLISYQFKEKCLEIHQKSLVEVIEETDEEIVYESEDIEYVEEDLKPEQTLGDPFEDVLEVIETFQPNDSPVKPRTEYTLPQKPEAINRVQASNNRSVAKEVVTNESCVHQWPNQKDSNLEFIITQSSGSRYPDDTREMSGEEQKGKKPFKNRKSYSSSQKLEVVDYAELTTNRGAAKEFGVDESCIRKWRSNKEQLIEIAQDRGTKRKPNLHWPELDNELRSWVNDQMSGGNNLKPSQIKARAIQIAETLNLTDFKGTSSYIFRFMERYRIPGRPKKDKS